MDAFVSAFQGFHACFDYRIVFLKQCFACFSQHNITKFDSSEESLSQTGVLIVERSCLSYQVINILHYCCIFNIVLCFCKLCEFGFLCSFCSQYIIIDDGFIHADGVFPIVAGTCILVCILNTDFVTGIHYLFQDSQTCTTNTDTWIVLRFHTFFYF